MHSSPDRIQRAIAQWRNVVESRDILEGEAIRAHYPSCTTASDREVPAVIRIRRSSVDEPDDQYIAETLLPILKIASENGIAVHPISTGNNWGYGTWLPALCGGVVLDLSSIDRIIDLDHELGVVTIEPGVTQAALARYLAAHGDQYMVPVTGAGPSCSILANALERGYGVTPIADHFAAVMAVESVLMDGTIYRSPMLDLAGRSNRAHFKWGLGPYLDGIFTQSGFGIVTRMKVALATRPECARVMILPILAPTEIGEVVDRVRRARSRLPGLLGGINLLNAHRALAMAAPYPWAELSPEGLIPSDTMARLQRSYGVADWTLFATLYGTARTVGAAKKELNTLFAGLRKRPMYFSAAELRFTEAVAKAVPFERVRLHHGKRIRMLRMAAELATGYPNETALPLAYWRLRSMPDHASSLNPARDGCGLIWYAPLIPMTKEASEQFISLIKDTLPHYGLEPLITMTTINDYCFDASIPLLFDRSTPSSGERARACYESLLEAGKKLGFVPYRIPVDSLPLVQRPSTAHGNLTRRLKRAVDPADLLSPGRYCEPYGNESLT